LSQTSPVMRKARVTHQPTHAVCTATVKRAPKPPPVLHALERLFILQASNNEFSSLVKGSILVTTHV
jgi:hypothetical protein